MAFDIPKCLLEQILLFRAQAWMNQEFSKRGVFKTHLFSYLEKCDGVIFGSFILACLLNKNWYVDFDFLLKEHSVFETEKTRNNYLRENFKKFTNPWFQSNYHEYFEPHSVCETCVTPLCAVSSSYHATISTKHSKWDFTFTPDPILHLNQRSFDIDKIYYDPKSQQFIFPQDFDLVKFVMFPTFHFICPLSLQFERIYDFYTPGGCKFSQVEQKWIHLGENYDCAKILGYQKIEEIFQECEKFKNVPKWFSLQEEEDTLTIFPLNIHDLDFNQEMSEVEKIMPTHLFKDFTYIYHQIWSKKVDRNTKLLQKRMEKTMLSIFQQHYLKTHKITPYRCTKTLYRILKMQNRGILCDNLLCHFTK